MPPRRAASTKTPEPTVPPAGEAAADPTGPPAAAEPDAPPVPAPPGSGGPAGEADPDAPDASGRPTIIALVHVSWAGANGGAMELAPGDLLPDDFPEEDIEQLLTTRAVEPRGEL